MFTDWHTYQIEKREPEHYPERKPSPPVAGCLKCGWAIDASKHYGHVFHFDHGTETIHVCRPSFAVLSARTRRAVERDR